MNGAEGKLRVAFMGTPDFAVPTLQALIGAGHDVVAVYSQPPARAGRGKKLKNSPVHTLALNSNIEVRTPTSLKEQAEQTAFKALDIDIAVVVAYGQILPQAILDAPKYGCVNVHASLLPRWRGAAPIHRAIMAGDEETGVCIMKMDSGLDTGPVIACQSTAISSSTTTASLHDALSIMGADMINSAIKSYCDKSIIPHEQSEDGITYAKKIDKAEAAINWSKSATEIDCLVRGLYPFPGAYTTLCGERIKILAGTIIKASGSAGTTLDDQLLVACGEGAYRIERAQRSGKGAMERGDFLRGMSIDKDSQFLS